MLAKNIELKFSLCYTCMALEDFMQFINYKYVINSEFSSSRSESLFKVYAIGHLLY